MEFYPEYYFRAAEQRYCLRVFRVQAGYGFRAKRSLLRSGVRYRGKYRVGADSGGGVCGHYCYEPWKGGEKGSVGRDGVGVNGDGLLGL